jgi:hypothetical protein
VALPVLQITPDRLDRAGQHVNGQNKQEKTKNRILEKKIKAPIVPLLHRPDDTVQDNSKKETEGQAQ